MDLRSHDIVSLGILGILERHWNFQRTKGKLLVCHFPKKGKLGTLAKHSLVTLRSQVRVYRDKSKLSDSTRVRNTSVYQ